MDDGPRIFTLEEANELVPLLNLEFERLTKLRTHIEDHARRLQAAGVDLEEDLGPDEVPEPHRVDAARLRQMVREVHAAVTRLNERGCLVKDLTMGLVDFYSVVNGEPAYLCWQHGEREVVYYHPLETGFAGRRPLGPGRDPDVTYN